MDTSSENPTHAERHEPGRDRDAHRIVFQPFVEFATREVRGYEALARFEDGRIPPAHLEQAEAEHRRRALELRLLHSAVTAAEHLPADMIVTVNASADTLIAPELGRPFPAGRRWGIELSETSALPPETDLLVVCHAVGAQLLLDDVGAANACEEWIRTIHPDIVKIDRAVVWGAAEGDPLRSAELDAFSRAARDVGATVVVEGIETTAHQTTAVSYGATHGQGYLYGRPGPV
ncbi:EAL domain-containing protein [Microbacterium excoecariae]|uniref:EAL domain-containing protein n=1 Tax=Microbacterium excoecariae TaxID=2715210 RepID=UPI0014090AE4|nr:EAL domain-containing protein [Microbacterium excoecariae]NHI17790.1 EAL domain-containing protein [Microbacterium excoecariae]